MDKSEPTLVPQWLKGASGCGSGSTSHHSSSSVLSDDCDVPSSATRYRNFLHSNSFGTRHNDYDTPRNSTLTDRTPFSSSRRGLSFNGGISDRENCDRAYSSFNRNSSFRSERDRDFQHIEKDREWERDLDFRDREKSFGGADYREKGQDRYDSHIWSTSSFSSKYETDATLKRSQSMLLNKRSENGLKKSANELGSITAPLVGGNIVSNINKAAFERNFPSLGSEDRQAGQHSNVTSTSSSSSIWHGQGTVGLPDMVRASSPSLSITTGLSQSPLVSVSVFGADGWSSALADAPVSNGGSNGPFSSSQQTTPGSSSSSVTPGSGLNMAEALVHNPPRVRTPPQQSVEIQRLEELALKQSRQLIPMTPSMPKTAGFGPSEKLKPKLLRAIDPPTLTGKVGHQPNSPLRATARPEPPKVPQGGKLLVLKSAREKNGVSKTLMSDSLSPTKGGNISNMSVCTLTAGAAAGGNPSLIGLRKSKIFLDRKTMPMSSTSVLTGLDCGTAQRSKDSSLVNEEKKPLSQAQNRSDFFNTLRKKASGSSAEQKAVEPNCNGVSNNESRVEVKENGNLESVCEISPNAVPAVEVACNLGDIINAASAVRGETDTIVESSKTGSPSSATMYSFMGGSEEEEAAFLRSLGWEENAGGEEALTEEEINAFHQQQMKSRTTSAKFSIGSCKIPKMAAGMHVGSLVSVSSELSSSDSEPDSDSQA